MGMVVCNGSGELFGGVRCVGLHARQDVLEVWIVTRCRRGRALVGDLDGHSFPDEPAAVGVGVAQVVESDRRDAGVIDDASERFV